METKTKVIIDPEIGVAELIQKYPQISDTLQSEYGFHCVNCMFSEFDTLEEGAALHGIEGNDLIDMIEHLEKIINE